MAKDTQEKGAAPVKVLPDNRCTTIIPSPDGKTEDTLCGGKTVIEDVPRPGRRCILCQAFTPAP